MFKNMEIHWVIVGSVQHIFEAHMETYCGSDSSTNSHLCQQKNSGWRSILFVFKALKWHFHRGSRWNDGFWIGLKCGFTLHSFCFRAFNDIPLKYLELQRVDCSFNLNMKRYFQFVMCANLSIFPEWFRKTKKFRTKVSGMFLRFPRCFPFESVFPNEPPGHLQRSLQVPLLHRVHAQGYRFTTSDFTKKPPRNSLWVVFLLNRNCSIQILQTEFGEFFEKNSSKKSNLQL